MVAILSFQMGVRFHPTDEEKMSYLLHKVTGQSMPCDDLITTEDLYGKKEPWEIFGQSTEQERYFFTRLKKIGKKNTGKDQQRFSRNVGNGTWMNKGQKVPIYGRRKRVVVGYKRCFRYERKRSGGSNDDEDQCGTWLLKEFVLPDKFAGQVRDDYKDYVLCVLKKKDFKKGLGGRFERNDQGVEAGLMDYMLTLGATKIGDSAEKTHESDSVRGFFYQEVNNVNQMESPAPLTVSTWGIDAGLMDYMLTPGEAEIGCDQEISNVNQMQSSPPLIVSKRIDDVVEVSSDLQSNKVDQEAPALESINNEDLSWLDEIDFDDLSKWI